MADSDDVIAVLRHLAASERDHNGAEWIDTWLDRAARFGSEEVPALLEALADIDEGVRIQAAGALAHIGAAASSALPVLRSWLAEDYPPRRIAAAHAIGKIAPAETCSILPILLDLLEHGEETVRNGAIEAVKDLKISDESALPRLVALLDDPEETIRWNAAEAICPLGSKAQSAVPRLVRCLRTVEDTPCNGFVRGAVAKALGHIGDRSAWEPLSEVLRDADDWVRFSSAEALVMLDHPEEGMPVIVELMSDPVFACEAVETLERLGAREELHQALKLAAIWSDLGNKLANLAAEALRRLEKAD